MFVMRCRECEVAELQQYPMCVARLLAAQRVDSAANCCVEFKKVESLSA